MWYITCSLPTSHLSQNLEAGRKTSFWFLGHLLLLASGCAAGCCCPDNFHSLLGDKEACLQQRITTVGCLSNVLGWPCTLSRMSGMVIETSTCPTIIDDKMRKEMESWKGEEEKRQISWMQVLHIIFAWVNICNGKQLLLWALFDFQPVCVLQNCPMDTNVEDCFCNKKLSGTYLRY